MTNSIGKITGRWRFLCNFNFNLGSFLRKIYITKTKLGIKIKLAYNGIIFKILLLYIKSWHAKLHIARACSRILEDIQNKWSDQKYVFY